jgi:hypothetical protein
MQRSAAVLLLLPFLLAVATADDNGGRCIPLEKLPNCRVGFPVYNATSNVRTARVRRRRRAFASASTCLTRECPQCFLCRACGFANATACPAPNTVATCAADARPYLQSNCCPSCIIRANTTRVCSRDSAASCESALASGSIPACAAGVMPVLNT